MLKLPRKYKERETLYQRLILFTLSLGLIVVYIPQILGLIGSAIWVCLPFIIGSFLSFVLLTLSRVLMKFARYTLKLSNPERFELVFKILTLVIVFGFIALLIAFVLPQLVSSIEHIASEIPIYLNTIENKLYQLSEKFPSLKGWLDEHQQTFSNLPGLISQLGSFLFAGSAGPTIENIQNVLSNTFSWIWIIFLSIAFSLIAFFNAGSFAKEGRVIVKAFLPDKLYITARNFMRLVSSIFTQYIGGTVLECIILASLVSVFGLIFQIPYAVLFGVFCGICALVPMFGATCGGVLCSLLLMIESPGKALTFLIMFICIQQIEGNFIYPNVVGKSVGLPPMFVIVSITIGASVAGILGMIISIPIASVIYAVLMDQARTRVEKKQSEKSSDKSPGPQELQNMEQVKKEEMKEEEKKEAEVKKAEN